MTSRPLELALRTSFSQLSASVPADVGIAVARSNHAFRLGQWSSGVAWSTVKVPLAIAALRDDPRQARRLVIKAITESDNPASEELWSQLGEPADAARKVQAVIAEPGDTSTEVESRRLRRGFTAFGQTRWDLDRQARFALYLPVIPDAMAVVELMHQLTPGHRWGLAAKGIAAKGGWGPGVDGGYLVRQFGIVPTTSGQWGVALAADAHDGMFETGVDAVNTLSDWLFSRLPGLARY
ncbi:MAG: hypothetical protein JO236_11515 [Mycobacterium sp.]|uniref:hypothetical protein n=1 Tax=Mycobacterium sp. TaxID=1785 RepID=UPI001ED59B3D|nr:hypothetical protein [Mycobacterium sp.]MBW0018157.1 hypothetical protein [Mycobacterium sp.]